MFFCGRCRTTKERAAFYPSQLDKRPNSSWCKACRAKHYSPVSQRRADLKRKFGITPEDYTAMHAAQGGVCAICEQPETALMRGRVMSLAIDHDHVTGKVRGLLCGNCNRAIGMLADDPERAMALAEYLVAQAACRVA